MKYIWLITGRPSRWCDRALSIKLSLQMSFIMVAMQSGFSYCSRTWVEAQRELEVLQGKINGRVLVYCKKVVC